MGHGIACNQSVGELLSLGARSASTPAEVATAFEVQILCVTGAPQVEAVLKGADGVLSALRQRAVMVDCSTSLLDSTLRMPARERSSRLLLRQPCDSDREFSGNALRHRRRCASTVENVLVLDPRAGLSGPAARGDRRIVVERQAAAARRHRKAGAAYGLLSDMAMALKVSGRTR
ncbi:NAD(P)-binding domain-containing protein [Bosea sp. NPDC055594]